MRRRVLLAKQVARKGECVEYGCVLSLSQHGSASAGMIAEQAEDVFVLLYSCTVLEYSEEGAAAHAQANEQVDPIDAGYHSR